MKSRQRWQATKVAPVVNRVALAAAVRHKGTMQARHGMRDQSPRSAKADLMILCARIGYTPPR